MEKATMYRATKTVIYKNREQMLNEATANGYFTSAAKAVDELRRYAEEASDAVDAFKKYEEGRAFAYRDVFVQLWVYEESEGRFYRTDAMTFVAVVEGKLEDNSGDPFFETF